MASARISRPLLRLQCRNTSPSRQSGVLPMHWATGRDPAAGGFRLDRQQTVLHREEGRSSPRRDADLFVDMLDVAIGGLWRDAKAIRDLLRKQTACEQTKDFGLARRDARRVRHRDRASLMACGFENSRDGRGVEPALARSSPRTNSPPPASGRASIARWRALPGGTPNRRAALDDGRQSCLALRGKQAASEHAL